MQFIKTKIPDLIIIKPTVYEDKRGYFLEAFNLGKFNENICEVKFLQDNESKSSRGVLRGLHFQKPPFQQAKLVRCIEGNVIDVVVDIRKNSKTFGEYVSIELSAENKKQLFIPVGFAHGFIVLSDVAVLNYKVDNYYNYDSERGIAFNDRFLNIDWKLSDDKIVLSNKDKNQPLFKDSEYF